MGTTMERNLQRATRAKDTGKKWGKKALIFCAAVAGFVVIMSAMLYIAEVRDSGTSLTLTATVCNDYPDPVTSQRFVDTSDGQKFLVPPTEPLKPTDTLRKVVIIIYRGKSTGFLSSINTVLLHKPQQSIDHMVIAPDGVAPVGKCPEVEGDN